ncbi:cardiolipin synthase [Pontibacillus salicampi]|uniref:Cardiolipin synthase n=1 Tax=Pontibacillus salicampi TaxID=1449801 RepID=A0ABV6LLX3_9BACI
MRPSYQILILSILVTSIFVLVIVPLSFVLQMVFTAIYTIFILFVSFYIILERRSSTNTMLWVFFIWFIPVFGYLFYIYSGQLTRKGILFKEKKEKATKVFEEEEPIDYASEDLPLLHQQRKIYNLIQSYADTPLRMNNEVSVLTNGHEAFPRIKEELKEAKNFIHMEYYLFNSDQTGESIMDILVAKAQEGVTVRLLYDSAGSLKLKNKDIKRMKQAGVEVHAFLPIWSGFFTQTFNFRNHRKIIVIDNRIAFVGGMNVGDEYRGISNEFPNWRDTHTIIKGKAIKELHLIFLVDWWYITNRYLIDEYSSAEMAIPDGWNTQLQVVPSGPHNERQIMRDVYTMLIHTAEESVQIATPYFVPSSEIHAALRIAAQRGVKVSIMVPKRSDSWLTYYASHSYFPELLQDGINIYLYEPGFMHHKIVLIDQHTASVGTANMDLRSFYLNFEVNTILYEGEPVEKLVANYEEDLQFSMKVQLESFERRSNYKKVKESFARLFSPLL